MLLTGQRNACTKTAEVVWVKRKSIEVKIGNSWPKPGAMFVGPSQQTLHGFVP